MHSFCLGSTASFVAGTARKGDSITSSKKKEKKRFRCKKMSKKKIVVLAIAVLVFVAALAGTIAVLAGGDGPSLRTTNATPSLAPFPGAPPPDIEGRCSPSNLPGSLPECEDACRPSACCYTNRIDETCIDEGDVLSIEACYRYRPYCDVIYDPWSGATEGRLRSPPQDIAALCPAVIKNSAVRTGASSASEQPKESFARKRFRHHVPRDNTDRRRRNLWVPTLDERCDLLCKSARCCRTPSQATGLFLASDQVYINHTSGEYAVANCQFGENKELCTKYANFCHESSSANVDNATSSGAMSTDSPTAAPMATEPPSPSNASTKSMSSQPLENDMSSTTAYRPTAPTGPSLRPSSNHGMTSHLPTFDSLIPPSPSLTTSNFISPMHSIPPASNLEIAAACSGDENVAMITDGVPSAHMKCLRACQEGLCCFADLLGYGEHLCYEDNINRCLGYLPCFVLVKWAETSNDTTSPDTFPTNTPSFPPNESVQLLPSPTLATTGNTAPTTDITVPESITYEFIAAEVDIPTHESATDVTTVAPPTPTQNLTLICSRGSSTLAGLGKCLIACEAGSCCFAQGADDKMSCYAEYPKTCLLYQPCMPFVSVSQGEENLMIEDEDPGLSIPTEENTPQGGNQLVEETPLPLPPPPPENMPTICSYESLATSGNECLTLCRPGVCCLDGSCLQDGGSDICDMYRPCYNLYLVSAPPRNFIETCDRATDSIADECTSICSAVSCCYSGSPAPDPTSSNRRLNSIIGASVCPNPYDPSVASTYNAGAEVELSGVVYRCNGPPMSFYCTQPNFAPQGVSEMWVDIWSEVGPCIPSAAIYNPVDSNPTSAPTPKSNESTATRASSSCYGYFEETCDEYAPYCAPATDIPPPPSYLKTLCDASAALCIEACKVASCCFESSPALSCYEDNKERCEDYSPCGMG